VASGRGNAGRGSSGRGTSTQRRYPDAPFRRYALAPGLIAMIALLAGTLLLSSDGFLVIRFIVAILGLIVGWFVIQAKHWWWLPVLAAIVVLWNPVLPFAFSGPWWGGAQYLAAIAFLAVGITVKQQNPDDRNAARGSGARR
jgi:hypothetical protein